MLIALTIVAAATVVSGSLFCLYCALRRRRKAEADRAEFAKFAETHPPPQSWYEEDVTGLRGPKVK